ncbi:hypothetical protein D3C85_1413370 [compost metagenome]
MTGVSPTFSVCAWRFISAGSLASSRRRIKPTTQSKAQYSAVASAQASAARRMNRRLRAWSVSSTTWRNLSAAAWAACNAELCSSGSTSPAATMKARRPPNSTR